MLCDCPPTQLIYKDVRTPEHVVSTTSTVVNDHPLIDKPVELRGRRLAWYVGARVGHRHASTTDHPYGKSDSTRSGSNTPQLIPNSESLRGVSVKADKVFVHSAGLEVGNSVRTSVRQNVSINTSPNQ